MEPQRRLSPRSFCGGLAAGLVVAVAGVAAAQQIRVAGGTYGVTPGGSVVLQCVTNGGAGLRDGVSPIAQPMPVSLNGAKQLAMAIRCP